MNRGNPGDDLSITAVPDFSAGFTVGSTAGPLRNVTVSGSIGLAAGKSLSVDAQTITLSTASADVSASGNHPRIQWPRRNQVLLVPLWPLSLEIGNRPTPTSTSCRQWARRSPEELGIVVADFYGRLVGKCAGQHTGRTFLFEDFQTTFHFGL